MYIYYIVYKTTNIINSKIYIGVHKQEKNPLLFDGYLGSNKLLKQAIKKYGKSNFKRDTIVVCNNSIDAYKLESIIVCKEFVKRVDVYNIEHGGMGNSNLGKYVTDAKIGIHALTFEERSIISKNRINNTPKDKLLAIRSDAGKIGGKICHETKSGMFSRTKEQLSIDANNSVTIRRNAKVGFFTEDIESHKQLSIRGGRVGGVKNKGFRWYTDGNSDFKYTKLQQDILPFDIFIENSNNYTKGRVSSTVNNIKE